jgi:hypothetical protein
MLFTWALTGAVRELRRRPAVAIARMVRIDVTSRARDPQREWLAVEECRSNRAGPVQVRSENGCKKATVISAEESEIRRANI